MYRHIFKLRSSKAKLRKEQQPIFKLLLLIKIHRGHFRPLDPSVGGCPDFSFLYDPLTLSQLATSPSLELEEGVGAVGDHGDKAKERGSPE